MKDIIGATKAEKNETSKFNEGVEVIFGRFFILPEDKIWRQEETAFANLYSSIENKKDNKPAKEIAKYPGAAALLTLAVSGTPEEMIALPFQKKAYCREIASEEAHIVSFYHKTLLEIINRVIASCPERSIEIASENIRLNHRRRRQALDICLKLLTRIQQDKFCEHGEEFYYNVSQALARSYLYRAMLIKKKGFSIPARKKEALLNAEAAVNSCDKENVGALCLKAQIYMALEDIEEEPSDAAAFFEYAALQISDRLDDLDNLDPEIATVFLKNAELNSDQTGLQEILDSGQVNEIAKAGAAVILNDPETANIIEAAINESGKYPFSHPCWENLTAIIRRMARSDTGGWKDLSLMLWEKCRTQETLTIHNSLIRWYWAHQQDIYDLAFFAASSGAERAEVADSLKGRTVLHRQVLEKMAVSDEKIAQYLAQENDGYLGRYSKNFRPESLKTDPYNVQKRDFEQLPDKEWLAVHFYISNGYYDEKEKDRGYALIYDDRIKEWREENFDSAPIWNGYQAWQEAYAYARDGDGNNEEKINSAPELFQLGKTLEQELAFLFDIEDHRPVVFIPFGFLHRLPLHMAIKTAEEGHEIWAEQHPSTFLPSWPLKKDNAGRNPRKQQVDILLKNFEENKNLNMYYEEIVNSWDGKFCMEKCQTPSLLEINKKFRIANLADIKFLFIFTHGLAHPVNPYASALEFADQPLLLLDFLSTKRGDMDLQGAEVFLAACEADMMPPQKTTVDEHLSFSGAFLEKGAKYVVSGLYQVMSNQLNDLGVELKSNKLNMPFSERLSRWQANKMDDLCDSDGYLNERDYFLFAGFRAMGLPG